VSDAGGSRRSYRNGRASAVEEGTPFPTGRTRGQLFKALGEVYSKAKAVN